MEGNVTVEDEEHREKRREVGCLFRVVFHRRAAFERAAACIFEVSKDISISRALSPRLSKTHTPAACTPARHVHVRANGAEVYLSKHQSRMVAPPSPLIRGGPPSNCIIEFNIPHQRHENSPIANTLVSIQQTDEFNQPPEHYRYLSPHPSRDFHFIRFP